MASPMVASLAALVKSKNPAWTPAQIMFQICGTADNIDGKNSGYGGKLGHGRINAYRALTETPPPPKPPPASKKLKTSGSKLSPIRPAWV